MKTLIDIFNFGMQRNYSEVLPDTGGLVLNLGAGNKRIEGTIALDYPNWNAEYDAIPYACNLVDMIHCYHFLEHIQNVPFVISEIERVLKPGGHVNIVVPYYNSLGQASDLDHKTFFTEKTFKKLFDWSDCSKGKCKPMNIPTCFIMGDCEANLCLVIQLEKKHD